MPPDSAGTRAPGLLDTLRIGLLAGLAGGAVELIPVLPAQASLGVPPLRMFQSIASGVLGRAAYSGGGGAAALGVLLHFTISVGAGLVFTLAAARIPSLRRHAVAAGVAFGVAVYLTMTFIVLPLSAVPFHPALRAGPAAISLTVHMLAFGLPIALVARWLLARNVRRPI